MQTSLPRRSPARLEGGETLVPLLLPAPSSRWAFPIPGSSVAATAPVISNRSPCASLAMSVPIRPVAPTRQILIGLGGRLLLVAELIGQSFPVVGVAEPLVDRDVEALLDRLEYLGVALPDFPEALQHVVERLRRDEAEGSPARPDVHAEAVHH